MSEESGNKQDMSVFDTDNPSLHPTVEAQDVSRLNKIVVPPGAYTDPNDARAAQGSINQSVSTYPGALSEDYAEGVAADDVQGVVDTHAAEQAAVFTGDAPGGGERSDNRDEWTKADWKEQASEYGLPVSGNMDALKSRVEDHEAEVAEAKDYSAQQWKDEIDGTDNTGDLADLKRLYEQSGADFSTVVEAFDAKAAELSS